MDMEKIVINEEDLKDLQMDQLEPITEEMMARAREEMSAPLFIGIESPNKNVARSIMDKLKVALRYEIEDTGFVLLNAITCTYAGREIKEMLESEIFHDQTRLLLEAAQLAEAASVIRGYLDSGVNVIATSYLTEFLCRLASEYSIEEISNISADAKLFIKKDTEIVVFSPVDAKDVDILEFYRKITNAAIAEERIVTKHFALDTELDEESLGKCVDQVIEIIKVSLEQKKELIDFANDLFGEEKVNSEEPEPEEEIEEEEVKE